MTSSDKDNFQPFNLAETLRDVVDYQRGLIEEIYSFTKEMTREIEGSFNIPFPFQRNHVDEMDCSTETDVVHQKYPIDINFIANLYFWIRRISEEIEMAGHSTRGESYKKQWRKMQFSDPDKVQARNMNLYSPDK